MLSFGPARCALDFEAPGKRAGFVDLDHSDSEHAFSSIRVPIGVLVGGDGPTILLTAGNHGDEYEGQIVLRQLMTALAPNQISGRLIMMPALNTPAMLDRARVSPLDKGNMNRAFPGATDQGPTRAIAGWVNEHLIAMADLILDFHSGGTATQYVDCAFLCRGDQPELDADNLASAECFGAPHTMICPIGGPYSGDFDTAAYRQNTRFLSCELGGMGTVSASSLDHGWRGCLRLLCREGLIDSDLRDALGGDSQGAATTFLNITDGASLLTTDCHGLAEPHLVLAQEVEEGALVATIHDVHRFGMIAGTLVAPQSGLLAVRRRNPVVKPGDHLAMICSVIDRADLT
ncbi:MAG: hypothetical protein CMM46_17435 [Rhodospirillaceae bacterium]|nr:hypothetical protein [Rhodospirillaceae bacterium]